MGQPSRCDVDFLAADLTVSVFFAYARAVGAWERIV
jgi:hypothetical protein